MLANVCPEQSHFFGVEALEGGATTDAAWDMQVLRAKLLRELRPGTRVVSHAFSMGGDWEPERQESVQGTPVYLWRIPPRKA